MANGKTRKIKRRLNATQIIVLGFIAVIAAGALLLSLPAATASRTSAPPLTALFTSVSATCVTGLVVEDTATYWSGFGHAVIITLIQIGGLGFMTVAVMMSIIIRRRVTPRERMMIAQSLNLATYENTTGIVKRVVCGTFIIEGAGAALLSIRFIPEYGVADGVFKSIFHSISAFCNAGFDLFGEKYGEFSSLTGYADDPLVVLTISALIITGGIGFVVWNELYNLATKKSRLSVYVKFVLLVTAVLLALSFIAVTAAEWNNSGCFGDGGAGSKLLRGLFQAVTPRTAGMATVDMTKLRDVTKLLYLALMFIGGSSGSTAGGIKTATFALVIFTVFSVAKGRKNVVLWKRKISGDTVLRALSITVIQLLITLVGAAIIMLSGAELMPSLFEAFSATGTVGLSLSLTPALNPVPLAALMLMMFFGRVGILTVTYALMLRLADASSPIEYPETNMLIG